MSSLRIEMFIPDTPAAPRLRLLRDLSLMCGGSTRTEGMGLWYDAHARPIGEEVHIYLAFTEDTDSVRLVLEGMARAYMDDAAQECVMYVLNSTEVITLKE